MSLGIKQNWELSKTSSWERKKCLHELHRGFTVHIHNFNMMNSIFFSFFFIWAETTFDDSQSIIHLDLPPHHKLYSKGNHNSLNKAAQAGTRLFIPIKLVIHSMSHPHYFFPFQWEGNSFFPLCNFCYECSGISEFPQWKDTEIQTFHLPINKNVQENKMSWQTLGDKPYYLSNSCLFPMFCAADSR